MPSFKTVGAPLGLKGARAGQLHAAAIGRLSRRKGELMQFYPEGKYPTQASAPTSPDAA